MSLLTGTKGHPSHPPLTDATIGMFTLAAGLALLGLLGWVEDAAAKGMWLALVGGLIVAGPTAVTGFLDWLSITRGTPLWRTATTHLAVMVVAVLVFAGAAGLGYDGFHDGETGTLAAIVTLIGFGVLTLGGWIGGSLVFVHGMRVEGRPDAPAREALSPTGPDEGA